MISPISLNIVDIIESHFDREISFGKGSHESGRVEKGGRSPL
jgi:hypothetical protein